MSFLLPFVTNAVSRKEVETRMSLVAAEIALCFHRHTQCAHCSLYQDYTHQRSRSNVRNLNGWTSDTLHSFFASSNVRALSKAAWSSRTLSSSKRWRMYPLRSPATKASRIATSLLWAAVTAAKLQSVLKMFKRWRILQSSLHFSGDTCSVYAEHTLRWLA